MKIKRVKRFPMADKCAEFVIRHCSYYNPEWIRQRYLEAQAMHESCMLESFYKNGRRKN
jgi:hypothetical protein